MKIAKIDVKGPIVTNGQKRIYEWLEMEAVSPQDIIKQLPENGEDVELTVNSPGGIVDAGSEIYTALMEYQGKITAKVVGMAASAASVVIMAADTVKISPTARIMIHNAWGYGEGDHRHMESRTNALKSADKGIRNAYMKKTGLSEAELTDLMAKETYMDADRAIELGFADEVMFQDDVTLVAASVTEGLLPQKVLEKVQNVMMKKEQAKEDEITIMRNELLREEIENSLK